MALAIALTIALSLCLVSSALAGEPSSGVELKNGSSISAPCSQTNLSTEDREQIWMVATLAPKHKHSSKSGVELAPEKMPRSPEFPVEVSTDYIPVQAGEAIPQENANCDIAAPPGSTEVKGEELALFIPGPYVLEEVTATVHWELSKTSGARKACGQNDKYYKEPDGRLEHPEQEPPEEESWVIASYCNSVKIVQFYVKGGEGECPVTQDYSEWPKVGYFNQYATGKKLGLPQATEGEPGGNACGPSSLLMAMRQMVILTAAKEGITDPQQYVERIKALPELTAVYDAAMSKSRAVQEPEEENGFNGNNALAFLHSLGWTKAEWVELGSGLSDVFGGNEQKIISALEEGPILISTAFGGGRWGVTGGGHVIMLNTFDAKHPGEVDVYDPAGNFFKSFKKHYNSRSCGFNVPYPMTWLTAYTTGRAFLKLGPPPAADPPVISVANADPGHELETFYLQNGQGQKTGWVQGQQVSEILGSEAGKIEEVVSDPDGFFSENAQEEEIFTPLGPQAPAPATIRLTSPEAGTTLHIGDATGGSYAFQADYWTGGKRSESEVLSGSISAGQNTSLSSTALATAISSGQSNKEPTQGGGNPPGAIGSSNTQSTGGSTSSGSTSSGTSSKTSQPSSSPAKPLTKAQKLAKALKACKKEKPKSKRRKCERQAKHKYGSKAPKKRKKK